MYDAFSGGAGLKGRRSFKKKAATPVVSASRGARAGRIADVEKAAPNSASRRRYRRIPTSVRIQVDGGWRRVAADISAGGALLLLPERLEVDTVVISIALKDGSAQWEAVGQIIRRQRRGERIAHHVHFTQPRQVIGLAAVIERCFAEGQERLLTV